MHRRCALLMLVLTFALSTAALKAQVQPRAAKTLDIYYIDVEGGQATLFVSPSGESLLVDTGFPGERDTGRIMEAVKAAGLTPDRPSAFDALPRRSHRQCGDIWRR